MFKKKNNNQKNKQNKSFSIGDFVVVIFGTERKYVETEAKKYFELISSLRRKIKIIEKKSEKFCKNVYWKGKLEDSNLCNKKVYWNWIHYEMDEGGRK